MIANAKKIVIDGLWKNNPGLVQLLGLCPLMAVTNNAINGLGLGMATIIALVASNVAISTVRHYIRPEIRIPAFIMIIAANVTIVDLLMNAFFHDLYVILGIFIPLIVTNCAVLGVPLLNAQQGHSFAEALLFGLGSALGFSLVLVLFAALRERLEGADVPAPFRGAPIALVTAGLMSLAFAGFAGLTR